WHFLIPICFLIYGLMYLEMPAQRVAIAATAILIVLALLFGYRGKRIGIGAMLMAIIETGRVSIDIVLIGAAAGLMVGILNITGLSFGMTMHLIALSGESVFLMLLLIAVLAFVLGTGLPTVSVYVLTATLLAPALVKLGVTPMAAHMFVMYFGMLSMITPPVAIAAYAAANIARVPGWNAGWTAVVVGWSTFFIPFLFVLEPSLLMEGPVALSLWNLARNLLGLFAGTAAVVGFAFRPLDTGMRLLFGAAALAILIPPNAFPGAGALDWIGLGGAVLLTLYELLRSRRA